MQVGIDLIGPLPVTSNGNKYVAEAHNQQVCGDTGWLFQQVARSLSPAWQECFWCCHVSLWAVLSVRNLMYMHVHTQL